MGYQSVKHGSTEQSVWLRAMSTVDGLPAQNIVYNSPGIALWYQRERSTKSTITPVELTNINDGWTSGGLIHIDDGYFRLDVPDAAFISGASKVLIGGSATDMVFAAEEIALEPVVDQTIYDRLGDPDPDAHFAAKLDKLAGERTYSTLLASAVPSGKVTSSNVDVYKSTAPSLTWTIFDATTGSPISLLGKDTELRVEKSCGTDLFSPIAGSVSGTDNNIVTVPTATSNHTEIGTFYYNLWNTTDNLVIARGKYYVHNSYAEDT